jgi:hypothetical protein
MTWMAVLPVAGLVAWLVLANPGTRPNPAKSPAAGRTDTYPETADIEAHTWNDYFQAKGVAGPSIGTGQTVQISCRVQGDRMQDGNIWWYRITSLPYYFAAMEQQLLRPSRRLLEQCYEFREFPRIEPGRFRDTHLLSQ